MSKNTLKPEDFLIVHSFIPNPGGPEVVSFQIYREGSIFEIKSHKVPAFELPMINVRGPDGFGSNRIDYMVSLIVWSSGLRFRRVRSPLRGHLGMFFKISSPRRKKVKVAE